MVTNQAYLFLIFIVNGIIIGLLFDFFRITRKVFKTNNMVTYIEDIIFWILTGIILLYSIFIFNNGELRLFMFLGVILGNIIYMVLISSYVIKFNVKLISLIIIPFQFICKILQKIFFKPITFLFINIRKSSTIFFEKVYNVLKKSKKEKKIVKSLQ